MTSGILFDFNGVIVDDEPQHCEALITTLAGYGYSLDRETYYREYLGFDDRECFRFTFERMGHSQDIRCSRRRSLVSMRSTSAGSKTRCSWYRAPLSLWRMRLWMVFSWRLSPARCGARVDLVLKLAGLRPHFAEIVAAEDVSACKPDPQGYNRARQLLDLAPLAAS